jgi:biopolymer transport protein ExbB
MDFLSQSLGLFHKGGPVMYLLLLCSLAVVAIAVERFIYYQNNAIDAQAFAAKLRPLLERQRLPEAIQLCEQTPSVISQIAGEGLHSYQHGGNVAGTLEAAAMLAAARLREYFNYLSAIVTLAPLFGLLGTVIGMISSFSVFHVQSSQPMAITGGVGEALVATAAGLSVAALALIVHTYFSHRLDKQVTDMEQICALVANVLSQKRSSRRETHEIA